MPQAPSLRGNITALYAVQVCTYVIPLLTLPWLTRVLGPRDFGRMGFCVAVVNYFVLVTDYGFNLSATRAISVRRADRPARSAIFWNTMTVKALLAAAGMPLLLALAALIPVLARERGLLMIAYLAVVGSVVTPTWYFLGTERQRVLSAVTIAVRFSAVPATFLLVHGRGDLPRAMFITAASPVIAGAACLALLVREGALERYAVQPRQLLATLQDGWHLFLSQISTSLYTTSNSVLLGLVSGPAAVGYYSAAERLTQAAQGLLGPINQSAYPRVSRLMHESQAEAYDLIRTLLRRLGAFALLISLGLLVTAPVVVHLLYGSAYGPTIAVMRCLAPLPFIVGLSNVFGLHTMLPLGMTREFTRILLFAGVLNIILLPALAGPLGAPGAAVAAVTSELVVTVAMMYELWRREIPVFGPHASIGTRS